MVEIVGIGKMVEIVEIVGMGTVRIGWIRMRSADPD